MVYKLIHTENYLLVVDEDVTQAKEGAWIVRSNIEPILCDAHFFFDFKEPYKKIIAHLPINSPILEGVDLLPPLEDEVKMLAEQEYDRPFIVDIGINLTPLFQEGFITGYNKAKETYKYTEKNINYLYDLLTYNDLDEDEKIEACIEFIQSLQQPKLPIAFECEMTCGNIGCYKMVLNGVNSVCCGDNMKPKTTTNSQGQTVWVGTYKY